MTQLLDADYLVVGAGAMGMGFTDALVERADVKVVMVDRRHGVGGHWLEAYPFVRLHQSSSFYGVASTVLGGRRKQTTGPEVGLDERADQPTICAYFADVLADRLVGSGKVELLTGTDYVGDRALVSRVSGKTFTVPERCRVVDARYLSPDIPAELPPRFEVGDGASVIPVNDVVHLQEAPSQYVVVGSGKTATDAIVWLLGRGVDPDDVCWVRPRDPWMLNRALIQPDRLIYLGMFADLLEAAASAPTLPDLFLRLEELGIMLRLDPAVTPTMAKSPTLGVWELELLRSIENVVRHGHLKAVERGRLDFADGPVPVAQDAVVVNCAADGLKNPPRLPIWEPGKITIQPVRAGFPCFGAAVTGYVEATRDDDAEKNRLCAPSSYGNSLEQWAAMNVLGVRDMGALGAEPDLQEFADTVALNPSGVPPDHASSPELDAVRARLRAHVGPGIERLAQLSDLGR